MECNSKLACSRARHFVLVVPLSTLVMGTSYKCQLKEDKGEEGVTKEKGFWGGGGEERAKQYVLLAAMVISMVRRMIKRSGKQINFPPLRPQNNLSFLLFFSQCISDV